MLSKAHLAPHQTARNQAISVEALAPGSVVVSVPSLVTALLPSEKGRRCDNCHVLESGDIRLRKCTGCAAYWYCGSECQTRQWNAHHKRVCKYYSSFVASPGYQGLSSNERVDAVLLSHLVMQLFPHDNFSLQAEHNGPLSECTDLLKGSRLDIRVPPICGARSKTGDPSCQRAAHELFSRFGNNNFVLHSHLNSYAHGMFPLASRFFNHSCAPNAVARYINIVSEPVRMEVVAIRDIAEGEEITIPYLDPALPRDTRRNALQLNYGFTCTCQLCSSTEWLRSIPPPARGSQELIILETSLRMAVFGRSDRVAADVVDDRMTHTIPEGLGPLFHESYLSDISERFSKASHEGGYAEALEIGLTQLALYCLVYPTNYPQIGMHALELAKTVWNAMVSGERFTDSGSLAEDAKLYLGIATHILGIFGPEGDPGGPIEEIRVLQGLLNSP
ncbi:hypothetical protein WOLCODRAFT_116534 [Wolfiporia cocos MD-104 SS10]|uniref:SET domain-containing protein n=1 Tax=Wolfiporia cocos (strain MD-104) TaxID=742152 RepID=A0A2H3JTK6_WOLCO|nr:hypothetical protein WOLCODRAFT_116534 [Wolfiporia cocos MD-104 SS10]